MRLGDCCVHWLVQREAGEDDEEYSKRRFNERTLYINPNWVSDR